MTSTGECGGAALRVLTDATLFRCVVAYASGWPRSVLDRWHEVLRQPYVFCSLERRLESFAREMMLRGDLRVLQLAACSTLTVGGIVVKGLPLRDVPFAVRSGHGETVRWVFEQNRLAGCELSQAGIRWCWFQAIDRFPGHCDVLEALKEYVPPYKGMWVFDAEKIESVLAARWLLEQLGAGFLPSDLLQTAVRKGNVPLVVFLDAATNQEIGNELEHWANEYKSACLMALHRRKDPQPPLSAEALSVLMRYESERSSLSPMRRAIREGHGEIVRFLQSLPWGWTAPK